MIKSKKIKLLGGLRNGRQEEKRKAIVEDYARIRVEIIKKDREMEEYKVVLKKMLSGYKIKMGIFPKDIMQENKVSYYVVDKENKVVKFLESKEEYEIFKKVLGEIGNGI